jgi:3'-phosphoadenosine 5'-phosphosulfate sulfotransferase (PAPS reductase)/FAD synthetase
MKIIVQYSGGKDSQASLLWAVEKYGAKNIVAQFSDTKWESSITYKHLKETCKNLGVKLIELTSKKYPNGMVELAEKKRRFPASKSRYCTSELKVIPFIDWLLDEVKDNILIIQGIRKDESIARSKMQESCRLFKYYLVPYTNNFIKLQNIEETILNLKQNNKSIPKTKLAEKQKYIDKLINGDIDNKYHTHRKKEVLKYIKKYDDSIMRPFFNATGQEVIDYIYSKRQKPNELYKMGLSRVGCFPCIMATHNEVKQIAKRFPERIDEIENLEKELNTTFFTTGKIPKYACENGKYPTIREVVNYVDRNTDMFEEEYHSCMSFYSQCE